MYVCTAVQMCESPWTIRSLWRSEDSSLSSAFFEIGSFTFITVLCTQASLPVSFQRVSCLYLVFHLTSVEIVDMLPFV